MKVDVADVNPRSQRHAERLNSAVQILVIHSVFVVPDTGRWVRNLVTHKPDSVIARVGFSLADRRASPGYDGRLHLYRWANG